MAAVGQRRGGIAPGAGAHRRRAQQSGAVIDLHRRHAIGVAHRAGQRQRIVLGQPAARDRRGRAGIGANGRADRLARRRGVHGRRHRRRGGGIAGRIDGLGGQAVRAVDKPQGGEVPVAGAHRRRAQQGGAVVDLHRGYAVGVAHRAGQRQRIVLGQPAARDRRGRAGIGADRRADRLARRRGVERDHVRRRGRGIAGRVGELGGDRLSAVGPQVARRHRKAPRCPP